MSAVNDTGGAVPAPYYGYSEVKPGWLDAKTLPPWP